jgi:hypothetical protein
MIPDYRNDTGKEAFDRIAPRVAVSLLGLFLSTAAWRLGEVGPAFYNVLIVSSVLVFLGVMGFWLPFTRELQLVAALWLAVSSFLFGVRGPPLWSTLAVSAGLLLVTLATSANHERDRPLGRVGGPEGPQQHRAGGAGRHRERHP